MNEQFCFGYACQVVGGQSRQAIEDLLLTECSRRFPDATWAGLWSDAKDYRRIRLANRASGYDLNRQLRAGDVVLFAQLFDGFRRLTDLREMLEAWDNRGVQAVALDVDLADGDAIEHWARGLHRLRACESIAIARTTGQPLGQPPLGWRWAGARGRRRLVPNQVELGMMRQAYDLHQQGHSRAGIARSLMLAGYRSPRTKREWSPSTCWRAVRAYASLLEGGAVPVMAATA